jgi:hypothetical protein
MTLIDHPKGHYRFLPGIAPYSGGVVAMPGYEIVHATLHPAIDYRQGFLKILSHLEASGRPVAALCGIELRSPEPYSFEGFSAFNERYARVLEGWGLFVAGVNPVARTNVAPAFDPPAPGVPMLHGFSFTRPCTPVLAPTFVVAGAGELPEGVLEPGAIVAAGDVSRPGIARKAAFVMDLMETRLCGLGVDWPMVTAVDVYTVHPFDHLLPATILGRIGPAAARGVCWLYSRPPIVGVEFEMDVRGIRAEILITGDLAS